MLAGVAGWLLRAAVSYDLGASLPSAPPLLSRYTHGGCDWSTGICSVPDRVTWLATGTIVLRVAAEAGGPAPTADVRRWRTEASVPSYPARRDEPPLGRPRRACTAKGSDVVLSGARGGRAKRRPAARRSRAHALAPVAGRWRQRHRRRCHRLEVPLTVAVPGAAGPWADAAWDETVLKEPRNWLRKALIGSSGA
jgi:hypothetical protein